MLTKDINQENVYTVPLIWREVNLRKLFMLLVYLHGIDVCAVP